MWAHFNTLEAKRRTEQANFLDPHSKIGYRPDGTEFWKLAGKDIGIQRNRVFSRDRMRCQGCGMALMLHECELDHVRSRGKGGDDSLPNLQTLCPPCHRKKHVRTRFGERNAQMAGAGRE